MGQSEIYPEPSAPPQPQDQYQETHQQSQRQAQGDPPVNFPDENHAGRDHQESSSKHVFYSIELLVFAFVGWGWLAIREYLGRTPVMDVVVVISVIVCALLNLVMALVISSTRDFAPLAHAFFSYCLVLWALYVYSLSESSRLDTGTLCCVDAYGNQGSSFSAGPTHAAAFFGGLPMHLAPGMVTVAYLTVLVLVSGAQARACTLQPKDWVVRGLGLSLTSLIAIHLGVYLTGVPLCDKDQTWGIISTILGVLVIILMVDFDWMIGQVYSIFLNRSRSEQQMRDHRLIRSAIQTIGIAFPLFYCLVIALVLEKILSVPLLVVFIVGLVTSCLGLGYEAVTLYGSKILGIREWKPEIESQARTRSQRGRIGQDMYVPSLLTRNQSSGVSAANQWPFLRRYPMFLQGQANRGKKSY